MSLKDSNHKVIGILSCRYSGSTMLDYMLGSHSHGLSLTELRAFVAGNRRPFSCKTCSPPESCPVWTPRLTDKLGNSPINSTIYWDISRHTGKTLLVDSSKNLPWFKNTMGDLPQSHKLIVLILKSPHRYIASEFTKVHKSAPKTISDALHIWLYNNLTFLRYLSTSGMKFHLVRYEDLVNHAPKVLSTILGSLGLEYQKDMEYYWDFEHHPLWGNPGARSHLKGSDTSDPQNFVLSEIDRKIYTQKKQTLYLDDKWKTVLKESDLAEIYSNYFVRKFFSRLGFRHPKDMASHDPLPHTELSTSWITKHYLHYLTTRHYPRKLYRKIIPQT